VNNLFFWIIVLSFLIPMAMRYYKKSVRGRNQNQDGIPGQFGQFPGDAPGNYPGQQSNQPRDGYTQRDYFGAFGQLGAPQPPTPPVPYEDSPGYPGGQAQPFPPQAQQSQPYPPQARQSQPQSNDPGVNGWQPTAPAPGPAAPLPPSAPQGFRARKLAELDQRYSDGELTMEDYMAQRAEIMKG
jgi:hypothetical protein